MNSAIILPVGREIALTPWCTLHLCPVGKRTPDELCLATISAPPCFIRHELAYPVCTEGSHFCGVKVWEGFPKVERKL